MSIHMSTDTHTCAHVYAHVFMPGCFGTSNYFIEIWKRNVAMMEEYALPSMLGLPVLFGIALGMQYFVENMISSQLASSSGAAGGVPVAEARTDAGRSDGDVDKSVSSISSASSCDTLDVSARGEWIDDDAPDTEAEGLRVGERVRHTHRGDGTVMSIVAARRKCIAVHFDTGEEHSYSTRSAMRLMRLGADGQPVAARNLGTKTRPMRRQPIAQADIGHHGHGHNVVRKGKSIEDWRKAMRDSRLWLHDRFVCALASWIDMFFLQLTTLALKALYCVSEPVVDSGGNDTGETEYRVFAAITIYAITIYAITVWAITM